LIIARYGIKTGVAMKTLSRRFRFVVLGVIVTVGVVSCYTFPSITDTIPFFGVDIGYWPLANRKDNAPIYVRWKSEDKFKAALEQVCGHHGEYDLFILRDNHKEDRWTKNCNPNHPRNIRIVKVTKSKAADRIAAGEPAANDPNVMHRIQSPDPGDIIKVLNTLEPAP
jgi:hypothetical protein